MVLNHTLEEGVTDLPSKERCHGDQCITSLALEMLGNIILILFAFHVY